MKATLYGLTKNKNDIHVKSQLEKMLAQVSAEGAAVIDGANIAAESIYGKSIVAESIEATQIKAGAITSDHITTNGIVADKIKTGVLRSTNGASWLNLNDGTFSYANGNFTFQDGKMVVRAHTIELGGEEVPTKTQTEEYADNLGETLQGQIDTSIKSTEVEYYSSTSSTSPVGGAWSTIAPEWKEGRFMWSRTKITPNKGSVIYKPNQTGTNISGATGASPIVGFLTNESITLPASDKGVVPSFTGATGTFEVYNGTTRKTGSGVTYSVFGTPSGGINVSINATTGVYTVSAMTGGTSVLSGTATLRAVHGGVTIDKILTVTKALAGSQGPVGGTGGTGPSGKDATTYWINASTNAIKKDVTGTIVPKTITFSGFSKTGTANPVAYAGRFIIQTSTDGTSYENAYTSSVNQASYTYTIPTTSSFVKAKYYLAGGTSILLDEQTIPVLVDAEGIDKKYEGQSLLDKTDVLSGTEIFTDRADDSVVHVEIDGNSYQHAGSGKNLWNGSLEKGNVTTVGIPPVYNESTNRVSKTFIPVSAGTKITVNAKESPTYYGSNFFIVYLNNGNYHSANSISAFPFTWTTPTGANQVGIQINSTNSNLIAELSKTIQIEEGSTATEYEPPAPTPDYPIAIHSLNDFDVVSSVGKRNYALSTDWVTEQVSTIDVNIPDYLKGERVTLSFYLELENGTSRSQSRIGIEGSNLSTLGNRTYYSTWHNLSSGGNYKGVVSSEAIIDKDFSGNTLRMNTFQNLINADIKKLGFIEVEKSTIATPYSPAPEDITENDNHPLIDKANILLSEPLRSVGDVKDRLFRDSDGLWKIHRRVHAQVLDGNTTLISSGAASYEGILSTNRYIVPSKLSYGNGNGIFESSSHLPHKDQVWAYDSLLFGTSVNGSTQFHFRLPNALIGVVSGDSVATRTNKILSWLESEKNKGNPFVVQYILEKSEIEMLPQTDQDKLNNIASYKDSNYLYTIVDKTNILPSYVRDNLKPTLHATFKGGGWYARFKTEQGFNQTNESVDNLKNETIPALKDGLLNSSEKEAVKQSLNVVSADKKGIDTQYTTVYANTTLTGTSKTNLKSAKDALNTAFTNLQSAINDVLGVGDGTRITDKQMTLVTTRLNEYGTALSTYNQRYEQAQDAISTKKKELADAYALEKANLAETTAKAYADGKITDEEKRAIADAQAKLDEAKKYVDDMEVGGRNLYLDSGRKITSSGYNIELYNFAIKPIADEKYTLSIKGKINPEHHTGFYTNIFNGTAHPAMATVGPGDLGSDGVYRKTFTMPNLADYISTILYSYPLGTNVESSVEWIKLEKGTKATDWTPAPEDVEASIAKVQSKLTVETDKITALTTRVSGSETNISNVTQTVSGINTTISTLRTDVDGKATIVSMNQVKSTADGNKTTISNHAGRLTTVETNVNGLQTTVASKAAQSQVTQLADGLSSVVTDLSNVDVIHESGVTGKTFRNVHTFYAGSSSVDGIVRINTPITNGAMTTIRFTGYNYQGNRSTIDLTVSFYAYTASSILQHSYTNRGDYEITNVRVGRDSSGRAVILLGVPTTKWSYPSIDVEYVKISFMTPPDSWKDGWSSSITTDTTGITALTTLQGMDTQSRIKQNANNINLRVTKGDVMSEINIEAGRTLISSKKLYLDADTVTFSGSAFIPNAAINSLSADKITAGSIKDKNSRNTINLDNGTFTLGNGNIVYNGSTLNIKSGVSFSSLDTTSQNTIKGFSETAESNAKSYVDKNTGNLVNNPAVTGTLTGWSASGLSVVNRAFEGVTTQVLQSSVSTDTQNYSDWVDVDPSKAYEVSMWIQKSANAGYYYVGLYGQNSSGAAVGFASVNKNGVMLNSNDTNFYFQHGAGSTNWIKVVGYIMPVGTNASDMANIGTNDSVIMKQNTSKIRIRFLNWSNAGTTRQLWVTNPKFVEVDPNAVMYGATAKKTVDDNKGKWDIASSNASNAKSKTDAWTFTGKTTINGGQIEADTIKAAQIDVANLSALSANLGNVTAGTITSTNGLIDINLNTGVINLGQPLTINYKPIATKEDVDSISVGGRNYFVVKDLTPKPLPLVGSDHEYVYNLEPNTTYTISTTGTKGSSFRVNGETVSFSVTGNKGYKVTTNSSGILKIGLYSASGETDQFIDGPAKLKLEKGNKATDWTEAPEDVEARIGNKADIEAIDNINSELKDYAKTEDYQKEIGAVNSSLDTYKSLLETIERDLKGERDENGEFVLDADGNPVNVGAIKEIEDIVSREAAVVNNLGELSERWNFIGTNIIMASEGLLIGETGVDKDGNEILISGIRVGKDRIDFVEKTAIISEITGSRMKINRAIFVQSISVGEHKIETKDGGHTIWTWVPTI